MSVFFFFFFQYLSAGVLLPGNIKYYLRSVLHIVPRSCTTNLEIQYLSLGTLHHRSFVLFFFFFSIFMFLRFEMVERMLRADIKPQAPSSDVAAGLAQETSKICTYKTPTHCGGG